MVAPAVDPAAAALILADGGVVLLPTDTLPGLHCRADRPAAVARIVALKGRAPDKPLLLLCASADRALSLAGALDDAARDYAGRCWPGPFTLVLPAAAAVPPAVTAGTGTVALRVPEPQPLRDLVAAAGGPLVSTSANVAGAPPALDLATALAGFGDAVDACVPGLLPPVPPGAPPPAASALIDLRVWPPRVLRRGSGPVPEPGI